MHQNNKTHMECQTSKDQEDSKYVHVETGIHALLNTIPHLIWIAQPDGAIIYNNQRLITYMGEPLCHAKESNWLTHVHPDDLQRVQDAWNTSIHTGEPYLIEHRLREGVSGIYHWFLVHAVPQRDCVGAIQSWVGTCTNIDAQKQAEEIARRQQERVRALMCSNVMGIFIANEEEIVEANDTFLRMTGYDREDLRQGRLNWMGMTAPADLATTQQRHDQLLLNDYIIPYEKEYIKKDGSHLPVLVGGIAVKLHPCQTICFVLDNSARKEMEQRKDDFFNMASHELRTPLTAVKLYAQIALRRLVRQGEQQLAEKIEKMAEPISQLERLISELLDVTRIQAGKLEYRQEPVEIEELLQEVANLLQQMNPSYSINVHTPGPVTLQGDRGRIEQIFINLLSNAIKYSPAANSVEIDMNANAESIIVDVTDHGFGIAPEEQEHIFERYYRVSHPEQGSIAGLGIGLYITAEIVKHHGGTISVTSEPGAGSTFRVTLPRS